MKVMNEKKTSYLIETQSKRGSECDNIYGIYACLIIFEDYLHSSWCFMMLYSVLLKLNLCVYSRKIIKFKKCLVLGGKCNFFFWSIKILGASILLIFEQTGESLVGTRLE